MVLRMIANFSTTSYGLSLIWLQTITLGLRKEGKQSGYNHTKRRGLWELIGNN